MGKHRTFGRSSWGACLFRLVFLLCPSSGPRQKWNHTTHQSDDQNRTVSKTASEREFSARKRSQFRGWWDLHYPTFANVGPDGSECRSCYLNKRSLPGFITPEISKYCGGTWARKRGIASKAATWSGRCVGTSSCLASVPWEALAALLAALASSYKRSLESAGFKEPGHKRTYMPQAWGFI